MPTLSTWGLIGAAIGAVLGIGAYLFVVPPMKKAAEEQAAKLLDEEAESAMRKFRTLRAFLIFDFLLTPAILYYAFTFIEV